MRYKVGRYTTGGTIVLLGILVLLQQMSDSNWLGWAAKLWPLVLIGYGLEYLLATRRAERTRFDFGGAFFVVFLVAILSAYSFFGSYLFYKGDMKYSSEGAPIQFAAHGVEMLDVEGLLGTITVEATTEDQIRIVPTYRSNYDSSIDTMIADVGLKTTLDAGKLTIKGHKTLGQSVRFNPFMNVTTAVDLHITAPAELVTSISNTFGSIEIVGMTNLRNVEQSFGTITIQNSRGKLNVDSDFGAVKIDDYVGELRVDSSFGKVEIDGLISGTWDVNNDFGSVEITLAQNSSFRYQFNVDFGGRDLPTPPFADKKSGSINGGLNLLKADVSFGSLEIKFR